jgi:CubicO group peptidase (beta-lactamase class C family)
VQSAAVIAVYRGHVLAGWGDVARRIPVHSVRKSFVSALYGTALARNEVDLHATLAQLGVDDDTPLTAAEKSATVRDLLGARSGVYLPAAYAPADQDSTRPVRGSHPPGSHWFYNNWDFNVAGVIFERVTGEELYSAFAQRIARPIGMEDYAAGDGLEVLEPSLSRHPAHTFDVSARDMARFGLLYLRGGASAGRQVLPEDWVRSTTELDEPLQPERYDGRTWGYRAGWWIVPRPGGRSDFCAIGRYGQFVYVSPDHDTVFVRSGPGRGDWGDRDWTELFYFTAERLALAVAAPSGSIEEPLGRQRDLAADPDPGE